jgi:hypothetical protein
MPRVKNAVGHLAQLSVLPAPTLPKEPAMRAANAAEMDEDYWYLEWLENKDSLGVSSD